MLIEQLFDQDETKMKISTMHRDAHTHTHTHTSASARAHTHTEAGGFGPEAGSCGRGGAASGRTAAVVRQFY